MDRLNTAQHIGYECLECKEIIDGLAPGHIRICDTCWEELCDEAKDYYNENILALVEKENKRYE